MKGSTLHRSGLTREKMNVLANSAKTTSQDKKQIAKTQLNQYYRATKAKEIDMLWNGSHKGIQKVHNIEKSATQKSPAAYFTIGFVGGVLFTCLILLITSAFSVNPKNINSDMDSNVAVIGETANNAAAEPVSTEEKYVIKSGDTLNGISYRFYGKYDEAKIQEIQRINNIKNPAAIKIGQELIIPVSQDR